METEIVNRLYDIKYRSILSFDRYQELLNKGLNLIQENGLSKNCNPTEQNAIEIGLDYITQTML